MRKRNNPLWNSCTQHLGLETKPEKRWFLTAFTLLFLYLWVCLLLRNFLFSEAVIGSFWRGLISMLQALLLCAFGVTVFAKLRITPVPSGKQSTRFRWFFPLIASVLTFGYLLLWLIAFFPGGFSPDSIAQYGQVVSGEYNNWHPVLHTWLFFWIPMQIFHHPAGIVLYQILLYSLSVGYLYRTLCRRGCPMPYLIFSWLFLFLNHQTVKIMLWPWKDSALTIVALVIFTQIIEIYETDGAWLKKWHHFLSFTALCFLASAFRHNAILLTVPIYVVLFLFLKKARKSIALSAVAVLLALWILNGPVMALANVEAPGSRQMEVLGLPMTILSEVYVKSPESLPEKAFYFMDSLASGAEWDAYYKTGNFNPIKWNSSRPLVDLVEHEGAKTILRYTVQAFLSNPTCALRGFAALTEMVWTPAKSAYWSIPIPSCPIDDLGITARANENLAQQLKFFADTTDSLYLWLFTGFIGMMILIMMFAAVTNIGRGKLGRAFMIFPVLIYDFGTMLLLTGPDFRFFHFNFVIIVPLLYLILSGGKKNETEAAA